MRKIRVSQILVFLFQSTAALTLAVLTTRLFDRIPFGDFRSLALTLIGLVVFYIYTIAAYRLFIAVFPLRTGDITENSQQEFIYHVYVLFYLMLFYPIMRSGFMPAPLMRVFYLALGTKLGSNTYSQGIIHDPPFIEVGNNSTIGQYAILVPHVIEGSRLAHFPIRIGDGVTIGAHSSILSDVVIGDNAIVATGAVVVKGTRIGAGEVWGGVPAKRIK
jgi:hypothetical protein